MPEQSEQVGVNTPLTDYQKRWFFRARILNRIVWGAIGCIFLAGLLTKAGLPKVVFTAYGAVPILLGFILFVFLNSCPRCEKNFYVNWIGILGCSNGFTSHCMNCGLSWKDLE